MDRQKVDEEPSEESVSAIKIDSYTHESISIDTVKRTDAFAHINRQITEADLKSPVTAQWLLSEHDKYDSCLKQLNELKDQFHEMDKRRALAETKLKTNTAFEVLYSVSLSMGAALIGAFTNFQGDIKWLAISIGAIMFLGGIAAKLTSK